ncbi:hypothetical protein Sj15T_10160 [Sphingobium sp. TA15]|uniref:Uncharacterized protein n=1 Tax=Sphingobium indicum (strain DSM 16413 / CCM 7287 / MTCC 6362 / UT26 / NBRC 101211 / UT26S) TaxID=452662 RepID=D4Z8T7_SPHIU|nr:hypothetical protein [Sphingobium indicum]BAI99019.1 hypothetical protein SJA_P1-00670 [Sphingobium indicum UT26S]BDD65995.1 hypothetical protein Sj15T_10160 [Sphingobium sp. TA15]
MSRPHILSIGSAPAEEACAQLGVTRNYDRAAFLEACCYRAAIIATHGRPPDGVSLRPARCAHDFGSYVEIQAHYDPADPTACTYAEQIENGLARWLDAGFLAPVRYRDDSQIEEYIYQDHFEAARRVMLTLERQRIDGFGTAAEAAAIAHLRAEYPRQSEEADQLLRQIATERQIRSPSARQVGLYASYRLTFFPALFNEARGHGYPEGDAIDVTAYELRTGRHRYIQCDIVTVTTIDEALSLCWEHMARYVI